MTPSFRGTIAAVAFLQQLADADGTLDALLGVMVPGTSLGVEALRRDLKALATDPLARGALILGPPGSGKSTLARTVSLLRYAALLTPTRVRAVTARMRADGPYRLAPQQLDWYVEFSLPGLAASVAEAQLFGFTEDMAAPGAERRRSGPGGRGGRPSIFEIAGVGRAGSRDRPTQGALATGGVVFLDEIGDLDEMLQPKLLAVLTGAPVYRVGGEGVEDASWEYRGLVIAATWLPVQRLRSDLAARLQDHVLHIPSLSERRDEIPELAIAIVAEMKAAHARWLRGLIGGEEATTSTPATVPPEGIDRDGLLESAKQIEEFALSPTDVRLLQDAEWTALGELRGLGQVIRRMMWGASAATALGRGAVHRNDRVVDHAEALLQELLSAPDLAGRGGTLVNAVGTLEERARRDLAQRARQDDRLRERLAHQLGITLPKLDEGLGELLRGGRPGRRRVRTQ